MSNEDQAKDSKEFTAEIDRILSLLSRAKISLDRLLVKRAEFDQGGHIESEHPVAFADAEREASDLLPSLEKAVENWEDLLEEKLSD